MIAAFTLNASVDRRYIVEGACPGAVNRVKQCTATAGGKGLNVARVIHSLGESVIAGGIAGGDLGNFIRHSLDREGIAHHFTPAEGETRCCINICDIASGQQTEYLEPGLTVQPEEYAAFLADFDELCAQSQVVILSGSLPRGLTADTYGALVTRAKCLGRPVLLDASGEALRMALSARPSFIKPNEDEIRALVPGIPQAEEELVCAARALREQGVSRVVISLGKRGAVMAGESGLYRAPPPALNAVNTVGCGDAMTAAFAVSVCRGMSDREALRYAVAVSAASAMCPGTGEVRQQDVKDLFSAVTVDSL